MRFLLFNIFLLAAAALLIVGCSPSGAVRYGSQEETDNEEQSYIRFTSENDTLVVDLNLDLKDPSDLPDDEPDIEISEVVNTNLNSGTETVKERMLMEIIKYLDTPYKYGGTDKNGIDCSAFTQNVYKSVLSYNLARTARLQFSQGRIVTDTENLKFGDLVFFDTRERVRPGHVGIYIGDHLFAHASSKKGVTISSLDLSYYSQRFIAGRRIENENVFGER